MALASTSAEPAIRLERVSVRIPLLSTPHRSLTKVALRLGTGGRLAMESGRPPEIVALDEISMEIGPGTRLGLQGHNGSGKTTLLRVIAGILTPTSGEVSVRGRVAAVINPSVGTNPESTGYETILVQSLIAGASRDEHERAIDAIATFTGLGPYLRLPIRTYSAGMRTRLAFAVATAYPADIVLIDEAIGTGDSTFAARAKERLETWLGKAGIVVMASHSEALLKAYCELMMRLEAGKILAPA